MPKSHPEKSHDRSLPPRLITADELAEMLCVSTRTLWRHLSTGKLPQPIRLGGSVRWRLHEVTAWIDQGCPQPATEISR